MRAFNKLIFKINLGFYPQILYWDEKKIDLFATTLKKYFHYYSAVYPLYRVPLRTEHIYSRGYVEKLSGVECY